LSDPHGEAETTIIPAVAGPSSLFGEIGPPPSDADTVTLPAVIDDHPTDPGLGSPTPDPSVGKASSSMMVATVVSKVTGMARLLVVAWVLGLAAVSDAYNAANTLPNQIYEFFVGGVLTTVLVPVLVRARNSDKDGGEAYAQRLMTMASAALLVVTTLAVVASPLLVDLVVNDSSNQADPGLATALAYLLLPQILFYGMSALFSAVLNARNRFATAAWAPVLNNVVALATFAVYAMLPGRITLNPAHMDTAHLLVLGIGSTAGVFLQSAVMIPPLLRSGFRFRMRWGWDSRFAGFGRLMMWTLAYMVLSQVGVVVVSNVATAHVGYAIYTTVWQLMHMPYAVIGYSLITAILPRMSRAASQNRTEDVVNDLSLANRLCSVTMLPLSGVLTVLGTPVALSLFSVGRGAGDAHRLGVTLAVAAFGILPYAITLIQFRVFYALNDARTPSLIMAVMMVVKVALTLLAPVVLPFSSVVYGLNFADSACFLVGAVVGEVWLRAKLGPLGSARLLRTLGKSLAAAVVGGAAAWVVQWLVSSTVSAAMLSAWLSMVIGGIVGMGVAVLVLLVLKAEEMRAVTARLGGILRR
jgi:putative peptidoglycan lipid II flippase